MEWTLKEIAELTDGRIVAGSPELICSDPVSDSRRVAAGAVFVPLRGESVDGHDFLADAARRGAAACLVRHDFAGQLPEQLAAVSVSEPAEALQLWATRYLAGLGARVVGITGSTGKTTTKEMTAAILAGSWRTEKNRGNLNTEIGLPLTVLRAQPGCEVLVLEMGMRGPGEILQLTKIAPPDVAVISNIGETHIELLGSVENIAAAKGEILQGLRPAGTAVLNGDDPLVVSQAGRAPGPIIWYGQHCQHRTPCLWADQVQVHGDRLEYLAHWQGETVPVVFPWPGRHNLHNSLAAVAVGLALGLPLKQCVAGLAGYQPADNRLRLVNAKSGARLIDDTYNASPVSMRAALQVLRDYPAGERRLAVLGDMLELGANGPRAHRELGELVAGLRLDGLFTVGSLAAGIADGAAAAGSWPQLIETYQDNQTVAARLEQLLRPGDLVLLKGSRGMRMEEIVHRLTGEEGATSDH